MYIRFRDLKLWSFLIETYIILLISNGSEVYWPYKTMDINCLESVLPLLTKRLFPREKCLKFTCPQWKSTLLWVSGSRPQFTRHMLQVDYAMYEYVYSLQSPHTSTNQIKSEEVRLLFSYIFILNHILKDT